MLLQFPKLARFTATAAACMATFVFARLTLPRNGPHSLQSSGNDQDRLYFPKGIAAQIADADLFSAYLRFISEPSLLPPVEQPVSYRLSCIYCQKPDFLVVRLSLKPKGNAEITTTLATLHISGPPTNVDRTQRTAIATDVGRFSQLIEKADFWSMPTVEQENADPKRRAYKVHAGHWVFEGVRDGTYHVVFREGPEPSPFTDMVRFLAKDVAKLDESAIPHAL